MVAGQSADKPSGQLPADNRVEAIPCAWLGLGQARHTGAVREKAADGLAVGGRRCGFHGTLVIDLPRPHSDPWRE